MTLNPSPARDRCDAARPTPPNPMLACETLDDRALLSLMLGRSADDPDRLACNLLTHFGSLGAVLAADLSELIRTVHAGPAVFGELKILRELAVRLARIEAGRRPAIASWTALLAYVRTAMAHLPREQFRVLYLDHRNTLLRDEWVAEGTVDHAPVYPREVVRRALELSASAMILVHNHPSGDPTPSHADIEMTRKVVNAAEALSLKVHDHLVIGRAGTASFKALGLI
ncbi:MAG: DNA repair protein RadC [Phenylobacterium sp.]|jgi:DNA repair protein RadC|uniref:RadC family protein n=1 Tax=Brevundimonas sp. BAL3 TaxID=391600 RepID=UPI0002EC1914|nr:DNA repair protein RadC [Brevundimonas sp. BAL3]MDZ4054770.1 DNA repair protein RadC [Phenylobacterium sp.]MDZ4318559.1 DNA repair protein RadC [Phenylobacterium sp.]|tara:strand:+ start:6215 stop:6898 length:684 start_codon:yes stop_codon:yes gene_type:complete